MRSMTLILIGCLLAGCGSVHEHKLDAKWRPLSAIVETDLPFVSDRAITTMGERCYVADLSEWLAAHPPTGPDFAAIMAHEQVHAQRQADASGGPGPWVARYLVDRDFAWEEEQHGWRAELRERRRLGVLRPAEVYAAILADYRNAAGKLTSYGDALAFVRGVLSGP